MASKYSKISATANRFPNLTFDFRQIAARHLICRVDLQDPGKMLSGALQVALFFHHQGKIPVQIGVRWVYYECFFLILDRFQVPL